MNLTYEERKHLKSAISSKRKEILRHAGRVEDDYYYLLCKKQPHGSAGSSKKDPEKLRLYRRHTKAKNRLLRKLRESPELEQYLLERFLRMYPDISSHIKEALYAALRANGMGRTDSGGGTGER